MSMSGVTLEAGITDYGVGEIQVKNNAREREALHRPRRQRQVRAKFIYQSMRGAEVERFVTDSKINRDIVEQFRKNGIEIVYK